MEEFRKWYAFAWQNQLATKNDDPSERRRSVGKHAPGGANLSSGSSRRVSEGCAGKMGGGSELGMIDIKEEGTEARSAAEAKKAIYKKAFKVRER